MRTMRRAATVARLWGQTAREVLLDHPRRCPEILGKAVLARALYGFGPRSFLQADLHNRPFRLWREHMKDDEEFWAAVHAVNWRSDGFRLARDKVLASERCAEHGIPYAPIIVVVGRDAAAHPSAGRFRATATAAELGEILEGAPERLLVKPAGGLHGKGILAATRADGAWRFDQELLATGALADRLLGDAPPEGLLVQPRLVNHPAVAGLMTGTGLSTVRLVMARTERGPRLIAASVKIIGGDSITDNFVGGVTGNLLGAVDTASGRITRVYGRRPGRHAVFYTTPVHPVTGVRLVGVCLPLWSEVLELADRATAAFHELPLPSLDVAITDAGPVFVETNTETSSMMQLVTFEGVRTTLRRVWPDLAVPETVRRESARHLAL